jgi:hypothetical protein
VDAFGNLSRPRLPDAVVTPFLGPKRNGTRRAVMSIRWVKNVVIDGVKSIIEIQLGDKKIGDKCYTRVGDAVEKWFENVSQIRGDIIAQGQEILKRQLASKTVTHPDGKPYDWQ